MNHRKKDVEKGIFKHVLSRYSLSEDEFYWVYSYWEKKRPKWHIQWGYFNFLKENKLFSKTVIQSIKKKALLNSIHRRGSHSSPKNKINSFYWFWKTENSRETLNLERIYSFYLNQYQKRKKIILVPTSENDVFYSLSLENQDLLLSSLRKSASNMPNFIFCWTKVG